MKLFGSLFLMTVLAFYASPGHTLAITDAELAGLTWNFQADPLNDHSGGSKFSTYGISCTIENGYLYVAVHTNFPKTGVSGSDSYTTNAWFAPGDLYINVGGTFQSGTGNAYGVATTSHGNNITQAYNTWGNPVTEGKLYSPAGGGPFFATGTWEVYQANYPTHQPDDGDGSAFINSYPTMIRYGQEVAGDVSGTRYAANNTDPWDFDIFYKIDLAAIGYTSTQDLQLFWVMECGNDGVEVIKEGEVPEPATMALLAAGLTAMAVKRRKTR